MIDYKFKDEKLFNQALTHKSWANENPGQRGSNERLEFLGDAVLELVVTDYLFKNLPDKEEGYLTNLRANIVNTVNLAELARKIDLGKNIFLSRGETKTGAKNDSLLADTVEAVIGAIYIDAGISAAKKFILENLLSDLPGKISKPLKDPKSRLQEAIQAEGKPIPKYKVVNITGPDHDRKFEIKVYVEGKVYGEGTGRSKGEAEQAAAQVALDKLKL